MNNETKHTQGEWERDGRFIYALGKSGKYKANLFSCSVSNDNLLLSNEEIEANAKLIAAAPLLLDALLVMLDSSNVPEWKKDLAINAINKATK